MVDEAHDSRTELAFDMLARFRPSGVMDLTATPDLERTPGNVLVTNRRTGQRERRHHRGGKRPGADRRRLQAGHRRRGLPR
jgi:hypothetical protein